MKKLIFGLMFAFCCLSFSQGANAGVFDSACAILNIQGPDTCNFNALCKWQETTAEKCVGKMQSYDSSCAILTAQGEFTCNFNAICKWSVQTAEACVSR